MVLHESGCRTKFHAINICAERIARKAGAIASCFPGSSNANRVLTNNQSLTARHETVDGCGRGGQYCGVAGAFVNPRPGFKRVS